MGTCKHELMTENFIGRIEQGRIGGNMCSQRLAALCARLGVSSPADIGLSAGRRHPTDAEPARPRMKLDDADNTSDGEDTPPAEPNVLFRAARERLFGTREALADAANAHLGAAFILTANDIGKIERGVVTWPRPPRRAAFRKVLNVETDAQLGFFGHRTPKLPAVTDEELRHAKQALSLRQPGTPDMPLKSPITDERGGADIFDENEDVAAAWSDLGADLAEYRKAAGYSQITFAPLTHYGRSTIANVERGRQRISRDFWTMCDALLSTNGELANEYDRIARKIRGQRVRSQSTPAAPGSEEATTNRRDVLTIPLILASAARTSKALAQADPDPFTLTEIEDDIERITVEYATTEHSEIFALAERRWTQVDQALAGRTSLAARGRLTRAAAQLSYFLSRLAFNFGDLNAARQIAVLAEQYARQVEERVILASVDGMRSSIAYYRGRYDDAVSVFEDYPSDPPYLAARNAAYRARAYARIGNQAQARDELQHMWRTARDSPPAPGDLPLGDAAIAMFAGWTHALIGEGNRAEELARQSVAHYVRSGPKASREEWGHALLMLGYALLNRKEPVVDEAATVVTNAIDVIRQYPTHTVIQRAEDFTASLHGYRSTPAVRDLHDRMQSIPRPVTTKALR